MSEMRLPFELVEATEYHGPYIVNDYGGTVCDFYTMVKGFAAGESFGGDGKPVLFEAAAENAPFMVKAANCHDDLVAALEAVLPVLSLPLGDDDTGAAANAYRATVAALAKAGAA